MFENIIALFLSVFYCGAILTLTWLFIHRKIPIHVQNLTAFGAGSLISLILLEMLPLSLNSNTSWVVSIIFIGAGFLVNMFAEFFILPRLPFLARLLPAEQHDCHQHDADHVHYHLLPSSVSCSVLPCFVLCAFFDGIRLSSTLLIETSTAVLVSVSLLFHLLPESIIVVGIGMASRLSRKILFIIVSIFCLSFLIGYFSFFFLSYIHNLEQFVLSFACGLFIYVSGVHLIPMVANMKMKKWFFIGLLLMSLFSICSHYLGAGH